ncbi:MAG: MraY family glycosyltransferase [Campylobacterota bacterium]|nr:MraY family glycosyltransferase [Campylobacterota bacterium]
MITVIFFLFTILLSYFSVKIILKYAHKLELYDVPNERSHHCNITPSGAGLGFIAALFISLFLFHLELCLEHPLVLLSIALVFAMGVYDDRHDVSAKQKFIVIFLAVFIVSFDSVMINSLGVWYGYDLALPYFLALPFTMFAIAGLTNAVNLIDGIDGLSGTVSIVILLFTASIGFEYHNTFIFTLSIFTVAALIGFLFLNWNPAQIFMGDSGSLSLGFIISLLFILSLEHVHPIAMMYIGALPLLDTLIVMVRRIRRKKSPFSPDKTHIHHIMVKFFDMNVKKTVVFLVILQTVFSSIGYMILDSINKGGGENVPLFAAFGFVLMFVLFYMIFTGIKKRQHALDAQ